MKKRIIISVIIFICIIGIISFIFFNNRKISTITLDINPSIEINLTKNKKVKTVLAFNDEAKDIIKGNLKGKTINKAIKVIINNVIDKGYANGKAVILLYSKGVNTEEIQRSIKNIFEEKEINSEIIVIKKISKKDEALAKQYNITPAKASYINSIKKDNDNVTITSLIEKSIQELKYTKDTGFYCDDGYTLDGNICFKEINRIDASDGMVCPQGYYEYNGKCYEEIGLIDGEKFICNDEFKLFNDKCIREETYEAFGKCDSGDYDNGYCVKKEYVGDAEEFCRLTPATDILMDHKCYGPKPTINGGCLNGDIIINGGCVDINSYYESDWRCNTGNLEEDKKCYKEVKTKPNSYYCEGLGKLNGTKCEIKETEKAQKERVCPSGYNKLINDKCINFSKITSKVSGFVCSEANTRLENNQCIIYDIVEAKNN